MRVLLFGDDRHGAEEAGHESQGPWPCGIGRTAKVGLELAGTTLLRPVAAAILTLTLASSLLGGVK
jgi:hypothetical protein